MGSNNLEKKITFGHGILYLYLESYWFLWVYWSPVCVTRETFFSPLCWKLSRGRALHLISHPSTPIQLPLKSCEQLCFYNAPLIGTFLQPGYPVCLSPRFESSGMEVCHMFCGRNAGQPYQWAQRTASSLLLAVTSKDPVRSFSVFKTSGQRGGQFFNLPHKHLQSTERD